MHIIGTAGHVDHGKSSLVEALTGTHPDRWAVERERGMTLDLGFARFVQGDIIAGIVDVPGHERFLHNMLAGASGMELLVLVVAAPDGVMPQTLQHLAILRHLNVRSLVVALTKCDLLDAEERREARTRITADLAPTIAADAPLHFLSSLTGEGIPAFRELLAQRLAELPPRDIDAPLYMPIDRVFTLPGRGTIVTGTLMQGSLHVGERVKLQPVGETARVRSVQIFGANVEAAQGGARVAINLPSLARDSIARGSIVAGVEFETRSNFAVRFTPERDALPLLRRRTPVRAYIGAAEILGTLLFETPPIEPLPCEARLLLRDSTVAFVGVRFVVRRISPKTLLGGGEIIGSHSSEIAASAQVDREAPHRAAMLAVLEEIGIAGIERDEIARRMNLRIEVVAPIVEDALECGDARLLAKPETIVGAAAADALLALVLKILAQHHESAPWAMGKTSLALAKELQIEERLLQRHLAAFAADGRIDARHGYYALTDREPRLTAEQDAFFAACLQREASAALLPIPVVDLESAVRGSQIVGIGQAYETLLAQGALVRVGEDLYRGAQIAVIRERVERYLQEQQQMTMAQFRTLIGSSRKYAVPLLEWLDSRGITVRSGDLRMLRGRGRNASVP
ncbi:MAG TPA: selenocysteine-specific translation elongation factor [Candidatus Dormibacteraeota bacterium]|nr:selenocysteine-specific translation elongation factor [Candidatus Dormibacteraeota bacterium]